MLGIIELKEDFVLKTLRDAGLKAGVLNVETKEQIYELQKQGIYAYGGLNPIDRKLCLFLRKRNG